MTEAFHLADMHDDNLSISQRNTIVFEHFHRANAPVAAMDFRRGMPDIIVCDEGHVDEGFTSWAVQHINRALFVDSRAGEDC